MKGFKNVNLYVENEGFVKTSLVVENGKIQAIGNDLEVEEYCDVKENWIVVPGFIDQHVHGAAASDAMDGTVEDISKIACALAKEGTTSFLATTMTQSVENITKALNAVKEYIALGLTEGAEIAGVHLEGPFISKDAIGAQPLEYVAAPSVEVFKVYEEASGLYKVNNLAIEWVKDLNDYYQQTETQERNQNKYSRSHR